MFSRYLLNSKSFIKKPVTTFFKSRSYLTGSDLVEFRNYWYNLPDLQRKQIAANETVPSCGDVLISKGDFFTEIKQYFQARFCYNEAARINKDCETLANIKLGLLDKIEKKLQSNNSTVVDTNEIIPTNPHIITRDYLEANIETERDESQNPNRRVFGHL